MNKDRVISTGNKSMICHRPGCKYVSKIKASNKKIMSKHDAMMQGYRGCKYCHSVQYQFKNEAQNIEFYKNNKKMQFNMKARCLYIKTEIGCWKISYDHRQERMKLYHRNKTQTPLDFKNPQYDKEYHCQKDKVYGKTIAEYLNYIYKHDIYKMALERGENVTHFAKKKYEKCAAKAKYKKQARRVDYLFGLLEKQNAGYKELSFC